MQVAAMRPLYLDRDAVPADVLDKEIIGCKSFIFSQKHSIKPSGVKSILSAIHFLIAGTLSLFLLISIW